MPRKEAATIVCVRGGEEEGGEEEGEGKSNYFNDEYVGEDDADDDNDEDSEEYDDDANYVGGGGGDNHDGHDDYVDDNHRVQYDEASSFVLLPAAGSRVSLSNSSNDSLSQVSLSTQQGAPSQSQMSCVAGEPLPIVRSFPQPHLATQVLPKYNYLPRTAPSPVRDSIVTYETMETGGDLILNSKEPFGCPGIASLQSYVKRGRGLAWQNRSSSKLHYETNLRVFDEHTRPKAKLLKIPHHVFYPDGGTVRQVVTGRDDASPNDIFFTAWDTWFEPLLNLYVTGTMIFVEDDPKKNSMIVF